MNGPSLLDKSFRYTKAAETDIRKTFAKFRREQKEAQAAQLAANVKPIRSAKAAKQ